MFSSQPTVEIVGAAASSANSLLYIKRGIMVTVHIGTNYLSTTSPHFHTSYHSYQLLQLLQLLQLPPPPPSTYHEGIDVRGVFAADIVDDALHMWDQVVFGQELLCCLLLFARWHYSRHYLERGNAKRELFSSCV